MAIKGIAGVGIFLLLIPLLIFTAPPNMFFGYGSSETESITHMTEQAMTIGGIYTSLEDFDGTQVDSIVTSIAADYEENGTAIVIKSKPPAISRRRTSSGSLPSTLSLTNRIWTP